MSNIAVIFAGGAGHRMNTKTKPKQFLELHGKPILIYTLEHFQKHSKIDGIILVMLKEYIDYSWELAKQYNIDKLKDIVPGGSTGQLSRYNGIKKAAELYPRDSIVLIHDGVRPLINEQIISDAIECVKVNGSAITVAPATETITVKSDTDEVGDIIDRSRCMLAKAPQCFYLGEILDVNELALKEGNTDTIDSACLMREYGHSLYTVEGTSDNIKITTPGDYFLFRAIIDAQENSQIFGL